MERGPGSKGKEGIRYESKSSAIPKGRESESVLMLVIVPEFVLEVGDLPLLGFVELKLVFKLSLGFAALCLLTTHLLLMFFNLAFEALYSSMCLHETSNHQTHTRTPY